jgi:hypothetical protein
MPRGMPGSRGPLELDGLDRPRADWARTAALRLLLRVDDDAGPEDVRATIASLQAQIYPRWSLDVVLPEGTAGAAIATCHDLAGREPRLGVIALQQEWAARAETFARDDRIGVLSAGDALPDYALAVIAEEIARPRRHLFRRGYDRGRRHLPRSDFQARLEPHSPTANRLRRAARHGSGR